MSLRSVIRRGQFFVLGSMLIALGVFAYLFDRPAYDFNFLLCGFCSIAIGLLDRSRGGSEPAG